MVKNLTTVINANHSFHTTFLYNRPQKYNVCLIFLPKFKAKLFHLLTVLRFLIANFTAAIKRTQLSEKAFWRGCDVIISTRRIFLLHFTIISTMSSDKGRETQKLQKLNTRMGAKRAVMKKRAVTQIQVKIVDEKKKSNQNSIRLELLFVDIIPLNAYIFCCCWKHDLWPAFVLCPCMDMTRHFYAIFTSSLTSASSI